MSTNVGMWSEGLSNGVSIIIRRYIDHMNLMFIFYVFPTVHHSIGYFLEPTHMKFAACMAVSFITFLHILLVLVCIIVYMDICFVCFCLIL